MKQHKLLYVVRHGETNFNKQSIIQGSGVDTSLNETGQIQARAFFEKYKHVPFDLLITSTLKRTQQTMRPFIKMGLPWEQNPYINEMNWGIHEGKKSTPAMAQMYQNMLIQWKSGNFHAKLKEGESAIELAFRIQLFIDELREKPQEKILICSHGRAMRCLMCLLKGEPLHAMENYQHSNTGLYIVRFDKNEFHFELENDTSHL